MLALLQILAFMTNAMVHQRFSTFLALTILTVVVFVSCQSNWSTELDTTRSEANSAKSNNEISDLISLPVTAGGTSDTTQLAILDFASKEFRFDTILEGDKVIHHFNFKNSGSKSLLIHDVRTSCGCTIPEWPKEPIHPGDSSAIVVSFDSKGRPGVQNKNIKIYANTYPNISEIVISGYVLSIN